MPAAWAQLIVLRVGAAIVHVTNGANLGRGWYAARVERRWGTLFLFYAASVVYHAVWNATAIGLSNGVFDLTFESFTLNAATLVALSGLLVLVALAGLGLLWLVTLVQRTARLVSTG